VRFDYEYLCSGLGHLTGLETQVYSKGKLTYRYAHFPFEPSPISLVLPTIQKSSVTAGYFDRANLLTFGSVRVEQEDILLVIGPAIHFNLNQTQVTRVLRLLEQSEQRQQDLSRYFEMMPPYPLENFLQILCFVNYALNDEKLTVADLIARETSFVRPIAAQVARQTEPPDPTSTVHNTYEMERTMLSYITTGNVRALEESFAQPPTGRVGKIAHDELRQRKNTLICAATLASRAAIAGGLSPETAFTLSDSYIQKAELISDPMDLTSLSVDMLLTFTKRVEQLKCGDARSTFVLQLSRYISENIYSRITMDNLARALSMNRSYLCERFKAETGKTPGAFIHEKKIDEAKHLLATTTQNISSISELLCYSSQSHFHNVFQRVTGCTPAAFRRNVLHTDPLSSPQ